MRPFIVKAIFQREMLDMVRDRRALISMVVVPLFVFPLLISLMTRHPSYAGEKPGGRKVGRGRGAHRDSFDSPGSGAGGIEAGGAGRPEGRGAE